MESVFNTAQPPILNSAPYRSAHSRSQIVVALLAIGIGTYVIDLLSTGGQIATGVASTMPSEDELTPWDLLDLALALVYIVVFISTVVAFCMWLYRAAKNLPALGNPRSAISHSPGWAVGSFFVPFVLLIIPYRAVREVWAKSDPDVPGDHYVATVEPPAPIFMKFWWGLWLVSNFVGNASARMYFRANSGEELLVASWLDVIGTTLSIPAALLAITVVREIDRRQEERSKRLQFRYNVPPPPPIFGRS